MDPSGESPVRVPVGDRRADAHNSNTFLTLLLMGSLALNLGLGWKVRRLQQQGEASAIANSPITGVTVSKINVADLAGTPHTLDLSAQSKPTVLYVFNPDCHWCARNLDNIRTLASSTGGKYQFIGVSIPDARLKDYVSASGINFPVYSIDSYRSVPQLRLGGTPETIVLSKDGKVIRNWRGAFAGSQANDVQAFFGVQLPGLASASASNGL